MRKLTLILVCVACTMLFSCVSKPPAKKSDKPGDLYVEGVELMKKKEYEEAIKKFSNIRENYPFDPVALVATVKLGDSQFEKKEYVLAAGTYEDFFKSHPEDENIPYVVYRLGECYEMEATAPTRQLWKTSAIDRDQGYVLKAVERFTYLKNRYPSSTYAKDAEKKLKMLIQMEADRELYVGEFYYRTAHYNAAIMRMENFLKQYPDAQGRDKAIYYLAMSQREMGRVVESEKNLDKLRTEYPTSDFLKVKASSAKRERKTLKPKAEKTEGEAPLPLYEEIKKRDIKLEPEESKAPPPAAPGKIENSNPAAVKEAPKGNKEITAPKDNDKDKPQDKGKDKESKDKGKSKDKGFMSLDRKKPVDIVSDAMEGFDSEKYVLFKGSVVAKQGDLSIFSDTMEAHMDEKNNEIEKAYARGNVKIVKQERTATCQEAIFDNGKGIITLKGNVIVYSGQDRLTGETILYFIEDDRVVVEGEKDKRAHIVVQPKQD